MEPSVSDMDKVLVCSSKVLVKFLDCFVKKGFTDKIYPPPLLSLPPQKEKKKKKERETDGSINKWIWST